MRSAEIEDDSGGSQEAESGDRFIGSLSRGRGSSIISAAAAEAAAAIAERAGRTSFCEF